MLLRFCPFPHDIKIAVQCRHQEAGQSQEANGNNNVMAVPAIQLNISLEHDELYGAQHCPTHYNELSRAQDCSLATSPKWQQQQSDLTACAAQDSGQDDTLMCSALVHTSPKWQQQQSDLTMCAAQDSSQDNTALMCSAMVQSCSVMLHTRLAHMNKQQLSLWEIRGEQCKHTMWISAIVAPIPSALARDLQHAMFAERNMLAPPQQRCVAAVLGCCLVHNCCGWQHSHMYLCRLPVHALVVDAVGAVSTQHTVQV